MIIHSNFMYEMRKLKFIYYYYFFFLLSSIRNILKDYIHQEYKKLTVRFLKISIIKIATTTSDQISFSNLNLNPSESSLKHSSLYFPVSVSQKQGMLVTFSKSLQIVCQGFVSVALNSFELFSSRLWPNEIEPFLCAPQDSLNSDSELL